MFRVMVDYCNSAVTCVKSDGQIQYGLAQSAGRNETKLYVTLRGPCRGRNKKKCPPETDNEIEQKMKYTLGKFMKKYSGIRYWAVENEPDLNGYSPTFAAKLWIEAQRMARGSGRTIVAGEFSMSIGKGQRYPGKGGVYPRQYLDALNSAIDGSGVSAPDTWSFHPYYDIVCNQSQLTDGFLSDLQLKQAAHLKNAVKHIWLSEAGVALNLAKDKCKNGTAMVNMGDPKAAARAQANAAWRYLTLPSRDRRIDHEFYWTPQPASINCTHGGFWDSGLWNPPASALRPAYYVLATNRPILPGAYLATVDAAILQAPEYASPPCGGKVPPAAAG